MWSTFNDSPWGISWVSDFMSSSPFSSKNHNFSSFQPRFSHRSTGTGLSCSWGVSTVGVRADWMVITVLMMTGDTWAGEHTTCRKFNMYYLANFPQLNWCQMFNKNRFSKDFLSKNKLWDRLMVTNNRFKFQIQVSHETLEIDEENLLKYDSKNTFNKRVLMETSIAWGEFGDWLLLKNTWHGCRTVVTLFFLFSLKKGHAIT